MATFFIEYICSRHSAMETDTENITAKDFKTQVHHINPMGHDLSTHSYTERALLKQSLLFWSQLNDYFHLFSSNLWDNISLRCLL